RAGDAGGTAKIGFRRSKATSTTRVRRAPPKTINVFPTKSSSGSARLRTPPRPLPRRIYGCNSAPRSRRAASCRETLRIDDYTTLTLGTATKPLTPRSPSCTFTRHSTSIIPAAAGGSPVDGLHGGRQGPGVRGPPDEVEEVAQDAEREPPQRLPAADIEGGGLEVPHWERDYRPVEVRGHRVERGPE